MGTIQRVRTGWLLGAFGACVLVAGAAHAQQIATERPGSILMFPKVVRDGARDTVIQITNTSNMPNYLRCFYLDGALGPDGRPVWTVRDFELTLTRQQPTHWRASQGRKVDIMSSFGSDEAGLDPGLVPSVPEGFTGALVCAEVTPDFLLPLGRNNVKGEATIEGPLANESKYNALAVPAGMMASTDNVLDLNGTEYAQCANASRLNFIPDGATDPVIEALGNAGTCNDPLGAPCNDSGDCNVGGTCTTGQTSVTTNLTVLPCNLDFQNGIPTTLSLNFDVRDEFEVLFSGSTTIDCWASFPIGILPALRSNRVLGGAISTQYATARISSSSGGPFVAIAESFHTDSIGNTGSAAVNLHMEGTGPNARILLSDNF
jgi:hypothetical protein